MVDEWIGWRLASLTGVSPLGEALPSTQILLRGRSLRHRSSSSIPTNPSISYSATAHEIKWEKKMGAGR